LTYNSTFLQKIEYKQIYAHKDWDGVISGGLILRIFEAPISFLNRLEKAYQSIIIEVPLSMEADIEKSLIIDHHDCKKGPLRDAHFGNIVICDESYGSVASLIYDYFELDIPENILDALDDVEAGLIEENELAEKMFIAFVSSIDKFPYNNIAELVRMGKWQKILDWINQRASSKEAELVKKLAKIKAEKAEILTDRIYLIKYKADDPLEVGAARLALIHIQTHAKIGIILGTKGIYASCGILATKKKRVNLYHIFKELNLLGWNASGRSDVGGFKIGYDIHVNQAIELLRRIFSRIK